MKGKEVKLGLSIVAVLLTIFGYLLYRKIQSPAGPPTRPAGIKTTAAESPKPTLSSGPATPPPKVVQPASGVTKPPETSSTKPAAAGETTRTWNQPAAKPPTPGQSAPVQPARLPLEELQADSPTQTVSDFASPDRYSRRYTSRNTPPETAESEAEGEASSELDPAPPRADRYSGSRYGNVVQERRSRRDSSAETQDVTADDAANDSTADAPGQSTVSDPFERSERVTAAVEHEPASPFAERNVLREGPAPPAQPERAPASRYSDAQAYDIYGRNAPRAEPPRPVSPAQRPTYSPPPVEEPRDEVVARPTPPPDREALVEDGDRYMVRANDNFWEIARRLYGDGGYFKALFEHNRADYPRPDLLRPGDVIVAPSASALAQTYPDLVPKPRPQTPRALTQTVSGRATMVGGGGRTYTVEEGDTLFDIARHELGAATRWVELYELNRETIGGDIDYLRPGTQLVLPGSERPDHIATRPGESSRR